STIALAVTVGVYGLVAGIVKLDDAGLALCQRGSGLSQKLGGALLWLAPWLMKTLSVVGTAAMFIVGGGILTHGFHALGHWIEKTAAHSQELPRIGWVLGGLLPTVMCGGVGMHAGPLSFAVVGLGSRRFRRRARHG